MERLKFVSYDGTYPCLCKGILKMELDGKIITFPRHCLISGGSIFNEDLEEDIIEDEWTIDCYPPNFPKELEDKATELVNENIPFGCCGGCI